MIRVFYFFSFIFFWVHFPLSSKIVARAVDRDAVCRQHEISISEYNRLFPFSIYSEKNDFELITPLKTGTHLVIKLLNLITGNPSSGILGTFQSLGENQNNMNMRLERRHKFSVQHFYYPQNLEYHLTSPHKTITLIRDPRDVLVSMAYYLKKVQKGYEKLRIDDILERLLDNPRCVSAASDFGFQFSSLIYLLENKNNVFLLRFEDLVGKMGGGSELDQKKAISNLGEFLEIPLNRKQIKFLSDNLFGQKGWTFRSGQIGSWKRHFNLRHKELFKDRYNEYLLYFGYEDKEDWD